MSTFAQLLNGLEKVRKTNNGWSACCPAHEDGHPSLSIAIGEGGTVLIYCHTGCSFEAILAALEWRGITWPIEVGNGRPPARVNAAVPRDIVAIMARIDQRTKPLIHTRADRYLTNRGITVRAPTELGFHPQLFHPWSRTTWPAMIGLVRDVTGALVDFQRTWLSYAEPITKAPVAPQRAWIGSISGHAVHLAPAGETLIIGEGVETTLSGMQLYDGLPGWAVLSAGNLVTVVLPPIVRKVIILVDNDPAGRKMARRAALRFRSEGLEVEGLKPPPGHNDFNDALQGDRHA